MILTRRRLLRLFPAAAASTVPFRLTADSNFLAYTDAQKESFLKSAAIVSVEEIGHGVTKPLRADLKSGDVTHSAKIQTVNKNLPPYFPPQGKSVPMQDSWHFNVAAYKIDRLLGLGMVTVTVARRYRGMPAALEWWVDDVLFEEVDRIKQETVPPNAKDFEQRQALMRVFDELVFNIDRNLSNILITKSWGIALIDHSRCFTAYPGIRNLKNLTRCSRRLSNGMKELTPAAVSKAVGSDLTAAQIQSMLTRRDRIVDFFKKEAASKGEENVFFS